MAQRLLALLLGIITVFVGTWAFPIYSHHPLIALHVVIGLVVVVLLLSLCAVLLFTVPVSQKARRDIHPPPPRQAPRQAISLTPRQRRRLKR